MTYTPSANYNGPDQICVQVCDNGSPVLCASATVDITVTPVNDAPVAVNDAASLNEDTQLTGNLGSNDTLSGDGGNVWSKASDPSHGTVVVNPDGTYVYTPAANFNGTDSFTYKLCDADGDCSTATVTITVWSVNDLPVAVDDHYTTNEGVQATGNLSTNDTPSGDGGNIWSKASDPQHGMVTVNADGTFVYTPNAHYYGTDSFIYEVTDANGDKAMATATITVNAMSLPPVAVDDVNSTSVDKPVSGQLLTNDSDPNNGVLTVNVTPVKNPDNGVVTINSDGTYTYYPNAGFTGTDNFRYQVCNDRGLCSTASVTITVVKGTGTVNNPPVATDDNYTGKKDKQVTGNILSNDYDPDGNTISLDQVGVKPIHGTVTVNPDGTFTYVPNAGYVGTDNFTYTINDGKGGTASAIVTLTLTDTPAGVNTTVAVDDSYYTLPGKPVSANVGKNDYDPEGDKQVSFAVVTYPLHGVLSLNTATGSFVYTPNSGYIGPDRFVYRVCDNGTPVACDMATAYFVVEPLPVSKMIKVNKHATKPVLNYSDGTYNWNYVITLTNLQDSTIRDIHVADDLTRVFASPVTYKVVEIAASGNLDANPMYDGSGVKETLLAGSLAKGKSDSIVISVKVDPHGFAGTVYNQAVFGGNSALTGTVDNILSDDPNGTGVQPRPTPTVISEITEIIPDGFSPNDDQFNDHFEIVHPSTEKLKIEVFNRWGNSVYKSDDYQNDWDGKGTGNFLGKNLPEGTYYFTLEIYNTVTGERKKSVHSLTLRR
jgi:gliding motility-associated-like protein